MSKRTHVVVVTRTERWRTIVDTDTTVAHWAEQDANADAVSKVKERENVEYLGDYYDADVILSTVEEEA